MVAGRTKITFARTSFGYDIHTASGRLGNTSDNYFLAYLTELYEGRGRQALDRFKRLAEDARTLQATELQSGVRREGHAFLVGERRISYSARFFNCTCPDWQYRRRLGGCKHIAALRLLDV